MNFHIEIPGILHLLISVKLDIVNLNKHQGGHLIFNLSEGALVQGGAH